jgi:hypothetical protein
MIKTNMDTNMENNNKEYPLLIAQAGPLEGQRWKMKSPLLVGRDSDCDIVIPMRQVSRHHTQVNPGPNGATVKDLESKNGTYVNGNLIRDVVSLKDGDELQIALAQHFIYLSSDATMPLEGLPLEMQPLRLRVDIAARRVWVDDEEIDPPLSASQFTLLQILYKNSGEVVSREKIIETVWGSAAGGVTEQALDALVRRLRDRLDEVDPTREYIITVRGHGLRLNNPPITAP